MDMIGIQEDTAGAWKGMEEGHGWTQKGSKDLLLGREKH